MKFEFKAIGGATWILKFEDIKIACDPVLCPKDTIQNFFWFKSKRLHEPVYEQSDFEDVDLWLLTHDHEDHLDEFGLKVIDKNSKIIIHKNLKKKLKDHKIIILKHNQKESFTLKKTIIEIEAIPAVHGVNPVSAFFAGGVNGYWLTIQKPEKKIDIYVSGDTVLKNKVTSILQDRKADIFIPNVGGASKGTKLGTLTMTAKMLKQFINIINPGIVLPVHYETFSHYNESIEEIKKLNINSIVISNIGEYYTSDI